jgi:2-keto-4-pentenoate hydratase
MEADPMRELEASPDSEVDAFAREMLGIFRQHRLVRQTAARIDSLSLERAYDVQDRCIAARLAAGERVVGWKIGCTSRAIQQQFGLTQPICGRLLAPHIYPDGAEFSVGQFTDCAVEPEMVFHIGRDLSEGMDAVDLRRSIEAVSAGIELHNYRFWHGQPSSQELIASNGIHAGLVIAQQAGLSPETNLDLEETCLFVNDVLVVAGIGAEIMGGPLNSLRWLVLHLAKKGLRVQAGDLVIPGSAVKLVKVAAGEKVEVRFASVGSCRASFQR